MHTFRSLRVRNYRLYAAGQLVSVTGGAMQQVAQGWLVLTLTDSGIALGTTVALQFLPMLVLAPWGGLVADRADKRRLLVATQVAGAVLAGVLGVLAAFGAAELWMVYVLAFLLGCVHVVDMPTRHAFVVEMVGPDELPNAIGLNSAAFNVGRLVGPAVAGLLIASVGVAPAFLFNSASYVATIAGLLAIRTDELFPNHRASRQPGQIRAGLAFVWATPALRMPLLLVAVVGTVGFNFAVTLPLLARDVFDGGPRLYGLLSSATGLGAVFGALATARRGRPTHRLLVWSVTAFGVALLATAAAPGPVLAAVVLVALGVALLVFLTTANATLQLQAPPALRGRVMALYGLVFLGSTPVGGPLVGWISEHWGPRAGLAFGGVVTLVAAAAGAVRRAGRRARAARRQLLMAHESPAAHDAAA